MVTKAQPSKGKGPSKDNTSQKEIEVKKWRNSLEMSKFHEGKYGSLGNAKASADSKVSLEKLNQKYKEAQEILDQVVSSFEKDASQSSDEKFLKNVAKSGTLKDKLSATTLKISENPLFRFYLIEKLLDTSQRKHRRESSLSVEALKDLFASSLLPDRKLTAFADRPLSNEKVTKEDLFYWIFEDKMKAFYRQFLAIVEKATGDSINNHRQFMIKILLDLILEKPEEEKRIITAIVNKLGDKEKSVCSKAVFSLNKIVDKHPGMKLHIAKEIETFIFRANVTVTAQYYSIVFLNQLQLSESQALLAEKLIDIYFALFEKLNKKESEEKKKKTKTKKNVHAAVVTTETKTEEEVENRILTQLLIGIRRALPYAPVQSSKFQSHLDDLYRSSHSSSILRSIQAAQLLFQMELSSGKMSDRYYRMLFERMLSPDLSHSHNWTQFLNLVYKSIKVDEDRCRVQAFVKRLMQCCVLEEPGFVCASLILISAIIKDKPFLKGSLTLPESAKKDYDDTYTPSDRNSSSIKKEKEEDSDDETEHFKDVEEEEEDYKVDIARVDLKEEEKEKAMEKVRMMGGGRDRYDPLKRDPKFSFADETCLWELVPFLNHFHPSVAKFARQIAEEVNVEYAGDPFNDFSRSLFFDRFAYKNPKKNKEKRHTSVMQKVEVKSGRPLEPANSESFLQRNFSRLPEDEKFLYNYFSSADKKPKSDPDMDVEEGEVDDDEFDAFLMNGAGVGIEDTRKKKKKNKKLGPDVHPDADDIEGLEELLRREIGVEDEVELDEEELEEMDGISQEDYLRLRNGEIGEDENDDEVDDEELEGLEGMEGDSGEESADFEGEFAGGSDSDDGEEEGLEGEEEFGGDEDDSEDDLDRAMMGDDDDEDEDSEDDDLFGSAMADSDDDSEQEKGKAKGKGKGKEEEKKGGKKSKNPYSGSTFADADDFAHLLESSGKSDVNPNQLAWENRLDKGKKRPPPKGKKPSFAKKGKR